MADTPNPSVPLLNLDTFTDRSFVKIDGEPYDLRNHGELSLLANRRLSKWTDRFNAILQLDEPTPDEEQESDRLLRSMVDLVLDAPADVRAKLQQVQQLEVINVFMLLRLRPANAVGAMIGAMMATEIAKTPIGASSSPDLSDSTQAAET